MKHLHFTPQLPDGWLVRPMKRLLSEPLKYGANETGEEGSRDWPRYIRITDFGSNGRLRDETFASLSPEVASNYLLNRGDLLFARSGATVGKCYYYDGNDGPACFAGYLLKATVKKSKLNSRYLYHFTASPLYSDWRDSAFVQATIENIGARRYNTLPVPLPPLSEQTRIAAYLDASCAAIDRAVATKQQQLATLDALRKSIIQKAVTQGLNPDVEMKDSGVAWLGPIPSHWAVRRIKDIVDARSGDGITALEIAPEGEFPVYGGNGLRGFTDTYTHEGHFVLIGRQGGLCGNINYATGRFFASEHAVVCTPYRKFQTMWFGNLLAAMNLNQYSNAAAQPGLSVARIKRLQIPIPPVSERLAIERHLFEKSEAINQITKSISDQIETLTAYRKSLIHECVTGQRRITDGDLAELTRKIESKANL